MNKISARTWVLFAITIINFIAFTVAFCLLPESVPVHFNANMEVDRVGSPYWMFILAIVPVLVVVGMTIELCFSKRNQQNKRVYNIIMAVICALFIWLGWVFYALMTSGAELGEKVNVSMSLIVMLPLGIFFIIMGNYLPKIRPNRTLGIKLPWTFKNEECWRKTHNFGGYIFVLAGVIMSIGAIICGVLNIDTYVFIFFGVAMLLLLIVPTIYAKVTYDKIMKATGQGEIIETTATPVENNQEDIDSEK